MPVVGDLDLVPGKPMDRPVPTVLLVEDEVLILALVQEVLEQSGYQVLVAENRSDALEVLESNFVDILVTDVRLRGSADGWEIARRARELNPEVPVLYVTGFGAADWPAEGVADSRMVMKPFDPQQIVIEVHDLLGGSPAG